jgi:hypothetical protein
MWQVDRESYTTLIFTKHQANNIKDTKIDGACGMHRGDEKCIKISLREPKRKRQPWRPGYR